MAVPQDKKLVFLWLLRVPQNVDGERLFDNLANQQQVRASDLQGRRRVQFLVSRTLLQFALAQLPQTPKTTTPASFSWSIRERVDLPPLAIAVNTSLPSPQVALSLSHSDNHIALAICPHNNGEDTRLGVDIEVFKSSRKLEAANYFCHPEEVDALQSITDPSERLKQMVRIWTHKEAFFKSHHRSILNSDLKKVQFKPCEPKEAGLKSAALENYGVVSVYHPVDYEIEASEVNFDAQGNLVVSPSFKLRWQSLA